MERSSDCDRLKGLAHNLHLCLAHSYDGNLLDKIFILIYIYFILQFWVFWPSREIKLFQIPVALSINIGCLWTL